MQITKTILETKWWLSGVAHVEESDLISSHCSSVIITNLSLNLPTLLVCFS